MNPKPIISGMVGNKRVSVELDAIRKCGELDWIRNACALVEQKVLELNPQLNMEEIWADNERFNAVLTFLLNRSTPISHLLYEYAVALRKMLTLLEAERLQMMRVEALHAVGGAR